MLKFVLVVDQIEGFGHAALMPYQLAAKVKIQRKLMTEDTVY